jgi:hypothetical protein
MNFEGFETIDFPTDPNIVYAIGIDSGGEFIPFYVGKTSRNIGRFGDYISAKFSAQTDFKVGEAVKKFIEKGYKVKIKFKPSNDRAKDEKELISQWHERTLLLNDLEGYDYKKAGEDEERKRIDAFVEEFINKHAL